ncbi:MAG: DUF2130 domain-containing protein [Bacteroidia bacterium]|nr:DUF2130 domain-containing protein [Bacteroidia bacterium]
MDGSAHVTCPSCGEHIDVNTLLAHQLEEGIKTKYEKKRLQDRQTLEDRAKQLDEEMLKFEEKKRLANETFKNQLDARLKAEKEKMEVAIKSKVDEEQSERIRLIEKELGEKTEQIKELNRTKAEIERLKRQNEEQKELIQIDLEKKLSEQLNEERRRIQRLEEEKTELKLKELEKQLEDQKKLTEEMKRKQEQGSMQLQGEVQELAIEEWLMSTFPLDTIEEIKKGAKGGDCIQVVNTRMRQNCGKIYYESKRTKEFHPSWIEKFKDDIRDKNANIGVLVTEVMPSDMDRLGLRDGIWICSFEEFKGLCKVLRQTIVMLDMSVETQANKGDKMGMLYDYLTSNAFRLQMEGIVEGFTQMQQDLDSEKRSMQRIWKSREKQIDRVINNTVDMYGSIKGIAGNAIENIRALELGPADDE